MAQQRFVPEREQRAYEQGGDPGMKPLPVHGQNWK
jgi:hypothetical protein